MKQKTEQKRGKFWIRTAAFAVVVMFTTTSVALPAPVSTAAAVQMGAPTLITIPSELGTIQTQRIEPKAQRVIVLIQDAHAVIDAQENIRSLINHMQQEYGSELFFVEGARDELDPTLLRTYPSKKLKKQVLAQYLNLAELSGAETASVLNQRTGSFLGLEDWDLYSENYLAFQRAQTKKSLLQNQLGNFKAGLDAQQRKVFSPELAEFQKTWEDFRAERISLLDLILYLSKFDSLLKGKVEFRELDRLTDSMGYEKSGKQMALEPIVKQMAVEYKKRFTREMDVKEQTNFHLTFQRFMTGQNSAGQMLRYLVQEGAKRGFRPKLTPQMRRLLGHAEILAELRGSRIYNELQRFLPEAEASLIQNKEERAIVEEYQKLFLLEDLVKLELTHEVFDEFQKNPDAYLNLLGNAGFRDGLRPALEFYDFALRRDQVFYSRLQEAPKDAKTIVMIAGGFHTNGLRRILEEKGESYAVVTPRIDSLTGQENYFKVMAGDLSYKDYLRTTYYDAMMRDAMRKLTASLKEPEFRMTLKLWRNNLIRSLAEERRITDLSQYTRYLDELSLVYQERFGKMQPRRSRSEILDYVQKELEKLRDESLGTIWKQFEDQLDRFTAGLQNLFNKKQLDQEHVTSLLNDMGGTPPAMLSAIQALDPTATIPGVVVQPELRETIQKVDAPISQIREALGPILAPVTTGVITATAAGLAARGAGFEALAPEVGRVDPVALQASIDEIARQAAPDESLQVAKARLAGALDQITSAQAVDLTGRSESRGTSKALLETERQQRIEDILSSINVRGIKSQGLLQKEGSETAVFGTSQAEAHGRHVFVKVASGQVQDEYGFLQAPDGLSIFHILAERDASLVDGVSAIEVGRQRLSRETLEERLGSGLVVVMNPASLDRRFGFTRGGYARKAESMQEIIPDGIETEAIAYVLAPRSLVESARQAFDDRIEIIPVDSKNFTLRGFLGEPEARAPDFLSALNGVLQNEPTSMLVHAVALPTLSDIQEELSGIVRSEVREGEIPVARSEQRQEKAEQLELFPEQFFAGPFTFSNVADTTIESGQFVRGVTTDNVATRAAEVTEILKTQEDQVLPSVSEHLTDSGGSPQLPFEILVDRLVEGRTDTEFARVTLGLSFLNNIKSLIRDEETGEYVSAADYFIKLMLRSLARGEIFSGAAPYRAGSHLILLDVKPVNLEKSLPAIWSRNLDQLRLALLANPSMTEQGRADAEEQIRKLQDAYRVGHVALDFSKAKTDLQEFEATYGEGFNETQATEVATADAYQARWQERIENDFKKTYGPFFQENQQELERVAISYARDVFRKARRDAWLNALSEFLAEQKKNDSVRNANYENIRLELLKLKDEDLTREQRREISKNLQELRVETAELIRVNAQLRNQIGILAEQVVPEAIKKVTERTEMIDKLDQAPQLKAVVEEALGSTSWILSDREVQSIKARLLQEILLHHDRLTRGATQDSSGLQRASQNLAQFYDLFERGRTRAIPPGDAVTGRIPRLRHIMGSLAGEGGIFGNLTRLWERIEEVLAAGKDVSPNILNAFLRQFKRYDAQRNKLLMRAYRDTRFSGMQDMYRDDSDETITTYSNNFMYKREYADEIFRAAVSGDLDRFKESLAANGQAELARTISSSFLPFKRALGDEMAIAVRLKNGAWYVLAGEYDYYNSRNEAIPVRDNRDLRFHAGLERILGHEVSEKLRQGEGEESDLMAFADAFNMSIRAAEPEPFGPKGKASPELGEREINKMKLHLLRDPGIPRQIEGEDPYSWFNAVQGGDLFARGTQGFYKVDPLTGKVMSGAMRVDESQLEPIEIKISSTWIAAPLDPSKSFVAQMEDSEAILSIQKTQRGADGFYGRGAFATEVMKYATEFAGSPARSEIRPDEEGTRRISLDRIDQFLIPQGDRQEAIHVPVESGRAQATALLDKLGRGELLFYFEDGVGYLTSPRAFEKQVQRFRDGIISNLKNNYGDQEIEFQFLGRSWSQRIGMIPDVGLRHLLARGYDFGIKEIQDDQALLIVLENRASGETLTLTKDGILELPARLTGGEEVSELILRGIGAEHFEVQFVRSYPFEGFGIETRFGDEIQTLADKNNLWEAEEFRVAELKDALVGYQTSLLNSEEEAKGHEMTARLGTTPTERVSQIFRPMEEGEVVSEDVIKIEEGETFLKELRNMMALNPDGATQGMPQVVAVGKMRGTDGRFWMRLRSVPNGRPLAAEMPGGFFGPLARVGEILRNVHAKGFLHNDIKTRNILVGSDGEVALIDFGSASLRGADIGKSGTRGYRAPEAVKTEASDVFGLAMTAGNLAYKTARNLAHQKTPEAEAEAATWAARADNYFAMIFDSFPSTRDLLGLEKKSPSSYPEFYAENPDSYETKAPADRPFLAEDRPGLDSMIKTLKTDAANAATPDARSEARAETRILGREAIDLDTKPSVRPWLQLAFEYTLYAALGLSQLLGWAPLVLGYIVLFELIEWNQRRTFLEKGTLDAKPINLLPVVAKYAVVVWGLGWPALPWFVGIETFKILAGIDPRGKMLEAEVAQGRLAKEIGARDLFDIFRPRSEVRRVITVNGREYDQEMVSTLYRTRPSGQAEEEVSDEHMEAVAALVGIEAADLNYLTKGGDAIVYWQKSTGKIIKLILQRDSAPSADFWEQITEAGPLLVPPTAVDGMFIIQESFATEITEMKRNLVARGIFQSGIEVSEKTGRTTGSPFTEKDTRLLVDLIRANPLTNAVPRAEGLPWLTEARPYAASVKPNEYPTSIEGKNIGLEVRDGRVYAVVYDFTNVTVEKLEPWLPYLEAANPQGIALSEFSPIIQEYITESANRFEAQAVPAAPTEITGTGVERVNAALQDMKERGYIDSYFSEPGAAGKVVRIGGMVASIFVAVVGLSIGIGSFLLPALFSISMIFPGMVFAAIITGIIFVTHELAHYGAAFAFWSYDRSQGRAGPTRTAQAMISFAGIISDAGIAGLLIGAGFLMAEYGTNVVKLFLYGGAAYGAHFLLSFVDDVPNAIRAMTGREIRPPGSYAPKETPEARSETRVGEGKVAPAEIEEFLGRYQERLERESGPVDVEALASNAGKYGLLSEEGPVTSAFVSAGLIFDDPNRAVDILMEAQNQIRSLSGVEGVYPDYGAPHVTLFDTANLTGLGRAASVGEIEAGVDRVERIVSEEDISTLLLEPVGFKINSDGGIVFVMNLSNAGGVEDFARIIVRAEKETRERERSPRTFIATTVGYLTQADEDGIQRVRESLDALTESIKGQRFRISQMAVWPSANWATDFLREQTVSLEEAPDVLRSELRGRTIELEPDRNYAIRVGKAGGFYISTEEAPKGRRVIEAGDSFALRFDNKGDSVEMDMNLCTGLLFVTEDAVMGIHSFFNNLSQLGKAVSASAVKEDMVAILVGGTDFQNLPSDEVANVERIREILKQDMSDKFGDRAIYLMPSTPDTIVRAVFDANSQTLFVSTSARSEVRGWQKVVDAGAKWRTAGWRLIFSNELNLPALLFVPYAFIHEVGHLLASQLFWENVQGKISLFQRGSAGLYKWRSDGLNEFGQFLGEADAKITLSMFGDLVAVGAFMGFARLLDLWAARVANSRWFDETKSEEIRMKVNYFTSVMRSSGLFLFAAHLAMGAFSGDVVHDWAKVVELMNINGATMAFFVLALTIPSFFFWYLRSRALGRKLQVQIALREGPRSEIREEAPDVLRSEMRARARARAEESFVRPDWSPSHERPPEWAMDRSSANPLGNVALVDHMDLNTLQPGDFVYFHGEGGLYRYYYLIRIEKNKQMTLWMNPSLGQDLIFKGPISNFSSFKINQPSGWREQILAKFGLFEDTTRNPSGVLIDRQSISMPYFSGETELGLQDPMEEARLVPPTKIRVLRAGVDLPATDTFSLGAVQVTVRRDGPRITLEARDPEAKEVLGEREIVMEEGQRITIGRHSSNDIRVAHPYVSKNHAELILRDGTLLIHDLDSTNGVYYNGSRIGADEVPLEKLTARSEARSSLRTERSSVVAPVRAEAREQGEWARPLSIRKSAMIFATVGLLFIGIRALMPRDSEVVQVASPVPSEQLSESQRAWQARPVERRFGPGDLMRRESAAEGSAEEIKEEETRIAGELSVLFEKFEISLLPEGTGNMRDMMVPLQPEDPEILAERTALYEQWLREVIEEFKLGNPDQPRSSAVILAALYLEKAYEDGYRKGDPWGYIQGYLSGWGRGADQSEMLSFAATDVLNYLIFQGLNPGTTEELGEYVLGMLAADAIPNGHAAFVASAERAAEEAESDDDFINRIMSLANGYVEGRLVESVLGNPGSVVAAAEDVLMTALIDGKVPLGRGEEVDSDYFLDAAYELDHGLIAPPNYGEALAVLMSLADDPFGENEPSRSIYTFKERVLDTLEDMTLGNEFAGYQWGTGMRRVAGTMREELEAVEEFPKTPAEVIELMQQIAGRSETRGSDETRSNQEVEQEFSQELQNLRPTRKEILIQLFKPSWLDRFDWYRGQRISGNYTQLETYLAAWGIVVPEHLRAIFIPEDSSAVAEFLGLMNFRESDEGATPERLINFVLNALGDTARSEMRPADEVLYLAKNGKTQDALDVLTAGTWSTLYDEGADVFVFASEALPGLIVKIVESPFPEDIARVREGYLQANDPRVRDFVAESYLLDALSAEQLALLPDVIKASIDPGAPFVIVQREYLPLPQEIPDGFDWGPYFEFIEMLYRNGLQYDDTLLPQDLGYLPETPEKLVLLDVVSLEEAPQGRWSLDSIGQILDEIADSSSSPEFSSERGRQAFRNRGIKFIERLSAEVSRSEMRKNIKQHPELGDYDHDEAGVRWVADGADVKKYVSGPDFLPSFSLSEVLQDSRKAPSVMISALEPINPAMKRFSDQSAVSGFEKSELNIEARNVNEDLQVQRKIQKMIDEEFIDDETFVIVTHGHFIAGAVPFATAKDATGQYRFDVAVYFPSGQWPALQSNGKLVLDRQYQLWSETLGQAKAARGRSGQEKAKGKVVALFGHRGRLDYDNLKTAAIDPSSLLGSPEQFKEYLEQNNLRKVVIVTEDSTIAPALIYEIPLSRLTEGVFSDENSDLHDYMEDLSRLVPVQVVSGDMRPPTGFVSLQEAEKDVQNLLAVGAIDGTEAARLNQQLQAPRAAGDARFSLDRSDDFRIRSEVRETQPLSAENFRLIQERMGAEGYEVLEVLSREGTRADVFRAWDKVNGREVAIKIGKIDIRPEDSLYGLDDTVASQNHGLVGHEFKELIGYHDWGVLENMPTAGQPRDVRYEVLELLDTNQWRSLGEAGSEYFADRGLSQSIQDIVAFYEFNNELADFLSSKQADGKAYILYDFALANLFVNAAGASKMVDLDIRPADQAALHARNLQFSRLLYVALERWADENADLSGMFRQLDQDVLFRDDYTAAQKWEILGDLLRELEANVAQSVSPELLNEVALGALMRVTLPMVMRGVRSAESVEGYRSELRVQGQAKLAVLGKGFDARIARVMTDLRERPDLARYVAGADFGSQLTTLFGVFGNVAQIHSNIISFAMGETAAFAEEAEMVDLETPLDHERIADAQTRLEAAMREITGPTKGPRINVLMDFPGSEGEFVIDALRNMELGRVVVLYNSAKKENLGRAWQRQLGVGKVMGLNYRNKDPRTLALKAIDVDRDETWFSLETGGLRLQDLGVFLCRSNLQEMADPDLKKLTMTVVRFMALKYSTLSRSEQDAIVVQPELLRSYLEKSGVLEFVKFDANGAYFDMSQLVAEYALAREVEIAA